MATRRRCPVCGSVVVAITTHLRVRHAVSGEDALLARIMGIPIVDLTDAVFGRAADPAPEKKAEEPLEAVVRRQVAALMHHASDIVGQTGTMDDWKRPAPDLSRYDDAFAAAAADCEHLYAYDLIHERQWHCPDCRRTFDLAELRRARGWQ